MRPVQESGAGDPRGSGGRGRAGQMGSRGQADSGTQAAGRHQRPRLAGSTPWTCPCPLRRLPRGALPAGRATCPQRGSAGPRTQSGCVSGQCLPRPSPPEGEGLCGAGCAHQTRGAHRRPAAGSAAPTGGSTGFASSGDRGKGASAKVVGGRRSPACRVCWKATGGQQGWRGTWKQAAGPRGVKVATGPRCPPPAAGGAPDRADGGGAGRLGAASSPSARTLSDTLRDAPAPTPAPGCASLGD